MARMLQWAKNPNRCGVNSFMMVGLKCETRVTDFRKSEGLIWLAKDFHVGSRSEFQVMPLVNRDPATFWITERIGLNSIDGGNWLGGIILGP